MKATELKIGDWVSYKGEVAQTYGFFNDVVWLLDGSVSALIEKISPVPLTKEMLEKNGWRNDADATLWTLGYLGLYWFITDKYYELCYVSGCMKTIAHTKVRYVHELQHLLWALGMNDDLKI